MKASVSLLPRIASLLVILFGKDTPATFWMEEVDSNLSINIYGIKY